MGKDTRENKSLCTCVSVCVHVLLPPDYTVHTDCERQPTRTHNYDLKYVVDPLINNLFNGSYKSLSSEGGGRSMT